MAEERVKTVEELKKVRVEEGKENGEAKPRKKYTRKAKAEPSSEEADAVKETRNMLSKGLIDFEFAAIRQIFALRKIGSEESRSVFTPTEKERLALADSVAFLLKVYGVTADSKLTAWVVLGTIQTQAFMACGERMLQVEAQEKEKKK